MQIVTEKPVFELFTDTEDDLEITDWNGAEDFEDEAEMLIYLNLVYREHGILELADAITDVALAKHDNRVAGQSQALYESGSVSQERIGSLLAALGFQWKDNQITVLSC